MTLSRDVLELAAADPPPPLALFGWVFASSLEITTRLFVELFTAAAAGLFSLKLTFCLCFLLLKLRCSAVKELVVKKSK